MAEESEAVESTAVEEPAPEGDAPAMDVETRRESPARDASPGVELAPFTGGAGAIIRAEEPREILRKAHDIAVVLKELIDSAGLAVNLDKRNPDRKHVEVGGWQATGTLLGALGGQPLHGETEWTRRVVGEDGRLQRTRYTATVKRYHPKKDGGGLKSETTYDVDGFDWEARVAVKTAAGVTVGVAEAMVGRAEETWSRRDDYALRSMAETRAESRAWRKAIGWIVHLAGYNPTPAEEMGHTPGAPVDTGPVFGEPVPDEKKAAFMNAVDALLQPHVSEPDKVRETSKRFVADVVKAVAVETGEDAAYVPLIVARALFGLANLSRTAADPSARSTRDTSAAAQAPLDPSFATGDSTAAPGDVTDEPPADAPSASRHPEYASGTVYVYGINGDPPRADLPQVTVADARAICTCPGGFDHVDGLPMKDRTADRTDDNCPIFNHGIPF